MQPGTTFRNRDNVASRRVRQRRIPSVGARSSLPRGARGAPAVPSGLEARGGGPWCAAGSGHLATSMRDAIVRCGFGRRMRCRAANLVKFPVFLSFGRPNEVQAVESGGRLWAPYLRNASSSVRGGEKSSCRNLRRRLTRGPISQKHRIFPQIRAATPHSGPQLTATGRRTGSGPAPGARSLAAEKHEVALTGAPCPSQPDGFTIHHERGGRWWCWGAFAQTGARTAPARVRGKRAIRPSSPPAWT